MFHTFVLKAADWRTNRLKVDAAVNHIVKCTPAIARQVRWETFLTGIVPQISDRRAVGSWPTVRPNTEVAGARSYMAADSDMHNGVLKKTNRL